MYPEWSNCDEMILSGCVADSIVDGPGLRFVVFVQGCPHHCVGCHNPQTHAFSGGKRIKVNRLLQLIEDNHLCKGVTLSGGEPFCQPEALAQLAKAVQAQGLDVMTYTGYTYEQLKEQAKVRPAIEDLLQQTNILVDGPFVESQRDLTLPCRGSRNQRVLRLKNGMVVGHIPNDELAGIPKNNIQA